MPRATYCQPQIGSFGYTEAQAKEKGYDVKTATFPFTANGKAEGLGEAVGFVKVVADAEHNEILGAHMIGPDVTELLPVLTLAQKWDLTADEVARNVFAHPTLGRGRQGGRPRHRRPHDQPLRLDRARVTASSSIGGGGRAVETYEASGAPSAGPQLRRARSPSSTPTASAARRC